MAVVQTFFALPKITTIGRPEVEAGTSSPALIPQLGLGQRHRHGQQLGQQLGLGQEEQATHWHCGARKTLGNRFGLPN
ncbi:hypothetical protein ON010_g18858 [Phytophthora cinnamomi]|nr:hypothetical protein ON010_g18858 [Phytophthora cinnamomi]